MRVSQRLTLGLVKTTESVNLTTQRLTLRLPENAPRANPDTSQRLTRGLVENGESPNPTTSPATDLGTVRKS